MKKLFSVLTIIMMLCLFGLCFSQTDEKNKNVSELLQSYEPEDVLDVVVLLVDINHETVLSDYAHRYPEEYQLYTAIKNSESIPAPDEFDSALLDNAIARKRDVYREYYGAANEAFAEDYADIATCLFVSHYSPLVILRASVEDLSVIEKDDRVIEISEYNQEGFSGDGLSTANAFTRANYVRDTCGNNGAGVKIGMFETKGAPNLSHPSLSQANIVIRSGCNYSESMHGQDHATEVASIMVGTDTSSTADGFAPAATLYCCRPTGTYSLYDNIEWLLDNYVNIINASVDLGEEGQYGTICKWVDHIAVQHDVHFVTSAGNYDDQSFQPNLITAPGMSYNAITVGAFDHGDATQWIQYNLFNVWPHSCYEETGTDRPEKPNLVADGVGFMGMQGTSFSSPQVAGVIAQLCSYNSAFKTKQSTIGAILMASAARKIETSGYKTVGSSFADACRIDGEPQISEKEGAGLLDARWARDVAVSGNYWSLTIYDNSFPYSKYVSLAAEPSKTIRVCIFWLRQNSISAVGHPVSNLVVGTMSNLDLSVYDPNGNLVDSSTTTKSNFEIVQFSPTIAGTYEIRITDLGGHTGKDYVGLALWKGNTGE